METTDTPRDLPDPELGHKAVELGLITEMQLRDAQSRLAPPEDPAAPGPRDLRAALLQLGLLTEQQIKAITRDTSAIRRKFGKYRIARQLGRGGMGVVYEAIDADLGRTVALKMLIPAPQTDPKEAALDEERFVREARVSANLPKHPGIVGVYESGAYDGRRYIAMEYVDGCRFDEWCKKATGSLRSQVSILRDAALAVDHAHRHGIIHRDLKPQNVLIDKNARPHVTDFGLARMARQDASLTLTGGGKVMGTPTYISPEQATGRKDVDKRTDVWALGVMLYELLAGRPPFRGETPIDIMMKITRDPVSPPSAAAKAGGRRGVDSAIENVCLKALAKDPKDRYASAKLFADDLSKWLKGETLVVAAVRQPGRLRPAWIGAAAALAAVILVFLVARPDSSADRTAANRQERAAELVAQGQRLMLQGKFPDALLSFDRAQQLDPDNAAAAAGKREAERRIAAAATRPEPPPPPPKPASNEPSPQDLVRKAQEFTRANPKDIEGQIRVWQEARTAAASTPLSAEAGRGLEEALGRRRQAVANELDELDRTVAALREAETFGVARDILSQAARRHDDPEWTAAVQSRQDDLKKAADVLYGPIREQAIAAKRNNDAGGLESRRERVFRWKLPDLLADLDEALRKVEPVAAPAPVPAPAPAEAAKTPPPPPPGPAPAPAKPVELAELGPLQAHGSGVHSIAFSSDGKLMMSAAWDQTARLWSMPSRTEKAKLVEGVMTRSVAFSPDGKWLAAGLGDGKIRIWDSARLQVRTLTGHNTQVLGLAFSPDSRLLGSASTDGSVRLWDPVSGAQRSQVDGHPKGAMSIAWSPDGKLFAVGCADRQVKLWEAASGRERRSFTDGIAGVTTSVAFSANGKLLAASSEDGTVPVWEVETGRRRELKGHTKEVRTVAWSPDGTWLVSASADESLRLWDAATGDCRGTVTDSGTFYGAAISRNGETLAGGSGDGKIRLWTMPTLRPLKSASK